MTRGQLHASLLGMVRHCNTLDRERFHRPLSQKTANWWNEIIAHADQVTPGHGMTRATVSITFEVQTCDLTYLDLILQSSAYVDRFPPSSGTPDQGSFVP
jgi:hypothetical protein